MPALLITIRSLPSAQERCPYCHGGLGNRLRVCTECGTALHRECHEELGRCTVLGCTPTNLLVQPHEPRRLRLLLGASALIAATCLWVLPNFLSGTRCTNDAAAIGALCAIRNAQTLYREGDKDGDGVRTYAASLSRLANTGPSGREDLIDEVLAGGVKQGYSFELASSSAGSWTATASPTAPGVTGTLYFGANMAGQIFYSETGPVRFNADASSPDTLLGRQ